MCGYIFLVIQWLVLGAIINPNAFLPFATAAITFVTYMVAKSKEFEEILSQGYKKIFEYIQKLALPLINGMMKQFESVVKEIGEDAKALLNSGPVSGLSSKLVELNIVDQSTLDSVKADLNVALDGKNLAAMGEALKDPRALLAKMQDIPNKLVTISNYI
jgi:hypothetical protein